MTLLMGAALGSTGLGLTGCIRRVRWGEERGRTSSSMEVHRVALILIADGERGIGSNDFVRLGEGKDKGPDTGEKSMIGIHEDPTRSPWQDPIGQPLGGLIFPVKEAVGCFLSCADHRSTCSHTPLHSSSSTRLLFSLPPLLASGQGSAATYISAASPQPGF
ncbi:hypothetical protein CRG98_046224 [Punica granatum]|uniref:Uncharacterized protein n=1 Tax=Punica granatum TaxID=22663 RepID=A0A2I0HNU1_PUNGR|nr:hypothetical protein CRG98_046224 [Punica granatum]